MSPAVVLGLLVKAVGGGLITVQYSYKRAVTYNSTVSQQVLYCTLFTRDAAV